MSILVHHPTKLKVGCHHAKIDVESDKVGACPADRDPPTPAKARGHECLPHAYCRAGPPHLQAGRGGAQHVADALDKRGQRARSVGVAALQGAGCGGARHGSDGGAEAGMVARAAHWHSVRGRAVPGAARRAAAARLGGVSPAGRRARAAPPGAAPPGIPATAGGGRCVRRRWGRGGRRAAGERKGLKLLFASPGRALGGKGVL